MCCDVMEECSHLLRSRIMYSDVSFDGKASLF